MKAHLGLLSAVLLAGLTGCAAKDANPVASAPVPAPATSAATTPVSPKPEVTISLPTGLPKTTKAEPPADAFQQVGATGTVRVSGQCVQLVTEKLAWVLVGPPAAGLRDGQRVKATGVPDPNRETGCTGSPLLVSKVDPA